MLQLIYVSSVVKRPNNTEILATSQRNNVRDGITGLLYSDGVRFMQVLEGPNDKVEAAYARIKLDPRHRASVVLSRRIVEDREFGPWDMAARSPGEDGQAFLARVENLIARAHPNVRATFEGFARVDRAPERLVERTVHPAAAHPTSTFRHLSPYSIATPCSSTSTAG